MKTELWAICVVILATLIGSWGSLLLKKGADKFSLHLIKLLKNYNIVFGLFLYVFSSVFFITALKGGELSVLYPMVSLSYVWVSLMSIKFLNERMYTVNWIGIAFIVLGVALIGLGR